LMRTKAIGIVVHPDFSRARYKRLHFPLRFWDSTTSILMKNGAC
jgi:hypothetical protein